MEEGFNPIGIGVMVFEYFIHEDGEGLFFYFFLLEEVETNKGVE